MFQALRCVYSTHTKIKKKLWNNVILNRGNVKFIYIFCKMKVNNTCNLSYNLLKRLNNKFMSWCQTFSNSCHIYSLVKPSNL